LSIFTNQEPPAEQEEVPEEPTEPEEEEEEAPSAAIVKSDIVGKNIDEAVAYLKGLGFENVNPQQGSPSADNEVNLVSNVTPTGSKVDLTETITLTYNIAYGDATPPSAGPNAPSEATVGDTFTIQGISSPSSCPAGLTANYEVHFDPAEGVLSLVSGVNNGSVQVEAKGEGTAAVSYTISCSRDGVEPRTVSSPVTQITVKAAPVVDPPAQSDGGDEGSDSEGSGGE